MGLSAVNGKIVETTPQPDHVMEYTPDEVQSMITAIDAQITELQSRKTDLETVLAQV